MKLLLLSFVFVSLPARAATHQFMIASKVFVGGKEVASPSVIVNAGMPAEISDGTVIGGKNTESTQLKVLAHDTGPNSIAVDFRFLRVTGVSKFRSARRFQLEPGKLLAVRLGEDADHHAIDLRIRIVRDGVIE